MSLTRQQLNNIASDMFTYFESNRFNNELCYEHRVNLVLEFYDYVSQMPDWELADWLDSQDPQDAEYFRRVIAQGADCWLGDLVKTISF